MPWMHRYGTRFAIQGLQAEDNMVGACLSHQAPCRPGADAHVTRSRSGPARGLRRGPSCQPHRARLSRCRSSCTGTPADLLTGQPPGAAPCRESAPSSVATDSSTTEQRLHGCHHFARQLLKMTVPMEPQQAASTKRKPTHTCRSPVSAMPVLACSSRRVRHTSCPECPSTQTTSPPCEQPNAYHLHASNLLAHTQGTQEHR